MAELLADLYLEPVDWTVFRIILTQYIIVNSHLEIAADFFKDLPQDLLEGFSSLILKGLSTCTLLGLCKFSSLNSCRALGRFIPRPA